MEAQNGKLLLKWETPEGYPFPMPVEVEVDGQIERIAMTDGKAELDLERYSHCRVDPQGWILKAKRSPEVQTEQRQK